MRLTSIMTVSPITKAVCPVWARTTLPNSMPLWREFAATPACTRRSPILVFSIIGTSNSLSVEEQRHVRENITEEELVIFDILTRPSPELVTEERAAVKKVARELLARLKELLVLNWRQKSTARSQLKLTIEDTLDSGLPRAYTPELYQQKCSAIFEHVFERYPERNVGVYA